MSLLKARVLYTLAVAASTSSLMFTPHAIAETPANEPKPSETRSVPETTETIYLSNATSMNDLNDIQTALRNNFPRARMYGVAGQNAIAVRATGEDMQGIKAMVAALDRPKKIYRVTYTISDLENGKRTGTQHYALIVASGVKTVFKQGKRVPLITGTSGESANASQSTQVQYIDLGMNIEANIEGQGLRTKVEQSTVADEKSPVAVQDPVIQQTMLEASSGLLPGKSAVLGSIEVPGTARHEEIEVMVEPIAQ